MDDLDTLLARERLYALRQQRAIADYEARLQEWKASQAYPSFTDRLGGFLTGASKSIYDYLEENRKQSESTSLIDSRAATADYHRGLLRHADEESDRKAREFDEKQRLAILERLAGGAYTDAATTPVEDSVEDSAPPTEMGAPNATEPLPILRAISRARTPGEAYQAVDPRLRPYVPKDVRTAIEKAGQPLDPKDAAEILAKVAQGVKDRTITPDEAANVYRTLTKGGRATFQVPELDPLQASQAVENLSKAESIEPESRGALASWLLGKGGAPAINFREKPEKPHQPTETSVALDAARSRLAKRGVTNPTAEQLGEEVEAGKTARAASTAAEIERARLAVPNPPPAEQQKVRLALIEAEDTLRDIKTLLPRVRLDKLAGGIRPWLNEAIQSGRVGPVPLDPEAFGGPLTPDEVTLLAQLHNYADMILRQRSGAAINELEAKRILAFLANPGVRPEVLVPRLDLQSRAVSRARSRLESQWKSFGYVVPKVDEAPPSATLDTEATPAYTRQELLDEARRRGLKVPR